MDRADRAENGQAHTTPISCATETRRGRVICFSVSCRRDTRRRHHDTTQPPHTCVSNARCEIRCWFRSFWIHEPLAARLRCAALSAPLLGHGLVTASLGGAAGPPRPVCAQPAKNGCSPCAWRGWWLTQNICLRSAPPPCGRSEGGDCARSLACGLWCVSLLLVAAGQCLAQCRRQWVVRPAVLLRTAPITALKLHAFSNTTTTLLYYAACSPKASQGAAQPRKPPPPLLLSPQRRAPSILVQLAFSPSQQHHPPPPNLLPRLSFSRRCERSHTHTPFDLTRPSHLVLFLFLLPLPVPPASPPPIIHAPP